MGSRPAKTQPHVDLVVDAAADLLSGVALFESVVGFRYWQHQAWR
jgi:hypothetical protein